MWMFFCGDLHLSHVGGTFNDSDDVVSFREERYPVF